VSDHGIGRLLGSGTGNVAEKITCFVGVCAAFKATGLQPQQIHFTGVTQPPVLWHPTCKTDGQRSRQLWMENATMVSIYDIFKVTSDGPLWVEAVGGLERAKERMAHLALTSPGGEYFIHSQEEGVIAKQTQEYLEEMP
jgi:hypothetical protein